VTSNYIHSLNFTGNWFRLFSELFKLLQSLQKRYFGERFFRDLSNLIYTFDAYAFKSAYGWLCICGLCDLVNPMWDMLLSAHRHRDKNIWGPWQRCGCCCSSHTYDQERRLSTSARLLWTRGFRDQIVTDWKTFFGCK